MTTEVAEIGSFILQVPPAVNARKRCALDFPQVPCWAIKWQKKWPKCH